MSITFSSLSCRRHFEACGNKPLETRWWWGKKIKNLSYFSSLVSECEVEINTSDSPSLPTLPFRLFVVWTMATASLLLNFCCLKCCCKRYFLLHSFGHVPLYSLLSSEQDSGPLLYPPSASHLIFYSCLPRYLQFHLRCPPFSVSSLEHPIFVIVSLAISQLFAPSSCMTIG